MSAIPEFVQAALAAFSSRAEVFPEYEVGSGIQQALKTAGTVSDENRAIWWAESKRLMNTRLETKPA